MYLILSGGERPVVFKRGDSNRDGILNLSDAVYTLTYLFLGGEALKCLDAADANDDGTVGISDAVYTLGYLFLGTPAPPSPGPHACSPDPTPDDLPECDYDQVNCQG